LSVIVYLGALSVLLIALSIAAVTSSEEGCFLKRAKPMDFLEKWLMITRVHQQGIFVPGNRNFDEGIIINAFKP